MEQKSKTFQLLCTGRTKDRSKNERRERFLFWHFHSFCWAVFSKNLKINFLITWIILLCKLTRKCFLPFASFASLEIAAPHFVFTSQQNVCFFGNCDLWFLQSWNRRQRKKPNQVNRKKISKEKCWGNERVQI